VKGIVTDVRSALSQAFDGFARHGEFHSINMVDIFAHGAMYIGADIPYINEQQISAPQRKNLMLLHLDAAALNTAWRQQRVWAVSFPMSQNDCKLSFTTPSVTRPDLYMTN
jgi:hypothetical protein